MKFGDFDDAGIISSYSQKKLGFNDKEDKKFEKISVNKISLRSENKFITTEEKMLPLINSIKDNGLLEPILICSIEDYLSANKYIDKGSPLDMYIPTIEKIDNAINLLHKSEESDKEKKLSILNEYKEITAEGFEYFIISGHRRFKAYISILTNQTVVSDQEWRDMFEKVLKSPNEEIVDSEWFEIPCYILTENELSEAQENTIYSDSNTTQRELTGFEVVVNTIDEMKANGEWDKMNRSITASIYDKYITNCSTNKQKKITEKRWIKKFSAMYSEEYSNHIKKLETEADQNCESEEELKAKIKAYQTTFLLSRPASVMTDGNKHVYEYLQEYISKNKGRSISTIMISKSCKLINTYRNSFMKLVYDGKVTIKQALNWIPIYKKIANIDELTDNQVLDILINSESNQKKSRKVSKVSKYTNKEIYKMLEQIQVGEFTVDEMKKLFE